MTPATQDDFNRQVDETLTRLEASVLALEIAGGYVISGLWPWQKRALHRALNELSAPYTSAPHRHEVLARAKVTLLSWLAA